MNNSELNYTVRDLTGVDIQPAREFPVDPANEAGFDNSADSLTMTPALLTKSLAAARTVAEHMVLTPNGIRFAPHPVVTETDRDKYCVKRIVEFYKRQPTDLADYFFAAWKIKVAPQQYSLTSESRRLSAKYLKQIQALLSDKPVFTAEIESSEKSADRMGLGPLAVLRRKWLDLPTTIEEAPSARKPAARCGTSSLTCDVDWNQRSKTFAYEEFTKVHNLSYCGRTINTQRIVSVRSCRRFASCLPAQSHWQSLTRCRRRMIFA